MDEIVPVESDRELFADATSVFHSADPAKMHEQHKQEFSEYFEYLMEPDIAPVPAQRQNQA